jgi:G:T/U-mismatch repair DNA glycosylase
MNEIAAEQGAPLPPDGAEPEQYGAAARSFLKKHKIWMKDVLQTYQRKKDPCSASDGNIERPRPEDCTNFLEVLKEHPSICRMVFTSKLACEWTFMAMRDEKLAQDHRDALKNQSGQHQGKTEDGDLDFKTCKPLLVAEIHGRQVSFFIAPSPSGGNGGLREDQKREAYKRLLFSACG